MHVLSGWKEIAQYLGQSIRTVQRWEQSYGLPIHRPSGTSRSHVIASREELDRWQAKTPLIHSDGSSSLVKRIQQLEGGNRTSATSFGGI